MTVKIFKLREDGERMKSYRVLNRVKAIERDDTGITFVIDGWNEDRKFRLDFEDREFELEVFP